MIMMSSIFSKHMFGVAQRDSRCYKTPKCFACASPLVVELRDGEAYGIFFGAGARFAADSLYVELRDGLFGAGTRFGVGSLYVELRDGVGPLNEELRDGDDLLDVHGDGDGLLDLRGLDFLDNVNAFLGGS